MNNEITRDNLRDSVGKGTIIDHIYLKLHNIKREKLLVTTGTINVNISDHRAIYVIIKKYPANNITSIPKIIIKEPLQFIYLKYNKKFSIY
jgi:hypothetical protein